MTKFAVGEIITESALKKAYDNSAAVVLRERLEPQDKQKKGERSKFKIIAELPGEDEYKLLKVSHFTIRVDNLIDDAYSEIEALGNEMREAFDNTPEGLQQSDIGQRREQAADTLEDIASNKPDVPDGIGEITLVFIPGEDLSSRPKRASEAGDMLASAALAIRDHIQEIADDQSEEESDTTEELELLADALENAQSDLDNVDFPGMYG